MTNSVAPWPGRKGRPLSPKRSPASSGGASCTDLSTKTGDKFPRLPRKPLRRLLKYACPFFRQTHTSTGASPGRDSRAHAGPNSGAAPVRTTRLNPAPAVPLLLTALTCLFLTGATHAQDIIGRASVIDGDTIEIHGTRIRLFAIDAVESRQSCTTFQGRRWPCGREAAFALADKIGTRPVHCEALNRDRYGRTVARCFIGSEDVAAWSVASGWSLAWARYSAEYLPLQGRAKSLGLGIWSGTFVDPQTFRKAR